MEIEPVAYGPLAKLVIAGSLLAICVVIHASGLIYIARWLHQAMPGGTRKFWRDLWLLVRVAWSIIALHLISIMVWGIAYVGFGCMPDHGTAFYFSSITYTTVGYGDVVLPLAWRNLAGVEAITGILLAGLSTAFFFAFGSRLLERKN